jgi:hypothetical protein
MLKFSMVDHIYRKKIQYPQYQKSGIRFLSKYIFIFYLFRNVDVGCFFSKNWLKIMNYDFSKTKTSTVLHLLLRNTGSIIFIISLDLEA